MNAPTIEATFPLGELVTTTTIQRMLTPDQVLGLLRLHGSGDWGLVAADSWKANDRARGKDERIMSIYEVPCKDRGPQRVWVITEADRSVTTVLFPEEY